VPFPLTDNRSLCHASGVQTDADDRSPSEFHNLIYKYLVLLSPGMKLWSRIKKPLLIVSGVLLLCGCVFSYHFWAWWRIGHDLKLWEQPRELIDAAYRALRLPIIFDPHDSYIAILEYGGPDSVPHLLEGLRKQPETHGVMGCTKSHCLEALSKLTGENCGDNYRDWEAWWNRTGNQIPPHVITFPATVTTKSITNITTSRSVARMRMSFATEGGQLSTFDLNFEGQIVGGKTLPGLSTAQVGDTCMVSVAALWAGGPKIGPKNQLRGQLTGFEVTGPSASRSPSAAR